ADCAEPILSNIAGTVQTEEAEGVEGAEVLLSGVSSDEEVTIASGNYIFDVVQNGFDYTVTPHLDENPLNGVTTFDLVLITKHILGIQILDSPYKMIAADVNSSGTITTADMIQLRKLILGIYTDFPNNTSWRFVDADYVFPDATNPWYEEFPESRNINNLSEDMMSEDFIAAKIGDVNGSATPNVTVIEERNVNGLFTLQTEDLRLEAGEQYTVHFTAADLDEIQGYQFTMNFDRTALSFAGMEYGVAQAENFGLTYVEEGMITSSWNAANGQTLKGDEILFSLVFTAQLEANLSEVISIGSRITIAEAYNVTNELLDVAMSFNTEASVAGAFEVYQNTPNPFAAETNIGYNLPEDAAVTITIQDITGRTIQVMHQDGMKGYNVVTLDAKTLGAAGTMYYTVATDKYVATKKMILVK
ncbi:MAG: T9SS C-terminal target domain-containing protein, partial [Bacteroidetes bacterium]